MLWRAQLSPLLAFDALRPVAAHLKGASAELRRFVDAQLLIAAQTTSQHANALYGAAALDLPRRGVVHLDGGMGAIANTLAERVRQGGGRVLYRHAAHRVVLEEGWPVAVETQRGDSVPADLVVLNLPARNIAELLGAATPARLRSALAYPRDGWSAFVLHIGLDAAAFDADLPLHHQVVVREPLGEGNSVFLSLSPAGDKRTSTGGPTGADDQHAHQAGALVEAVRARPAGLREPEDGPGGAGARRS